MTCQEALALYHPIRASVRRILSAAISVCNQSDFMRAAKQLGLWVEGTIALPEGDQAADMLSDIALFELVERGRRAFDVFLASKVCQLDAADFELAQRMGKALFSLFRCTGRHGIAGVWLEDQLDRNRTLWLMDEGMEASAPTKGAFGMRLFGASEFHVGFLGSSCHRMRGENPIEHPGHDAKWPRAIPAFARSDAVWRQPMRRSTRRQPGVGRRLHVLACGAN